MDHFTKSIGYGLSIFIICLIPTIPGGLGFFENNLAYGDSGLELTNEGPSIIDLNDPEVDRGICVYAEFTDFELSDGSFNMKIINQKTEDVIYDSSINVGSTKTGFDNFNSVIGYIVTENMIANNEVSGGDYFIEVSTVDGLLSKRLPFKILDLISPDASNGGGSSYAVPSITQVTFTSLGNPNEGFGGIIQNVDLNSLNSTQIIKTGDDALIRVKLSDADGASDIDHLTIYLNYNGNEGIIPFNSIDTFITYQKGKPLRIIDPNGLIAIAGINIVNVDASNFVLNLEIKFDKTMNTSNIAFRSWDLARNEVSIEFFNAIQVIDANNNLISGAIDESTSNWISKSFDWWSQGLISDSEFFGTMEFLIINGKINSDLSTLMSNLVAQ